MTLDSNPLRIGLPKERAPGSCVFVIFGGTGDLAERKLLPALYHLHLAGLLPRAFAVIAYASQEMTDESYREWVHNAIVKSAPHAPTQGPVWDSFSQALFYCRRGDDMITSLGELRDRIRESADPSAPRATASSTSRSRRSWSSRRPRVSGRSGSPIRPKGWKRLIVEKPFGADLESARELNRALQAIFPEDRIYRIDHYLGKETVQNILVFRFANEFVEPLLNREHVDHIQITVAETIGIEKRGAFYDSTGALRDIVQNHMLQMMALTMMDRPESLEAEAVRDAKAALLRGVRPIDPGQVSEICVRGQYGRGLMLGEEAPAYREEEKVAPDSTTETFVALKLFVDNPRWQGVPVYLRTGKRLPKRVTEIGIQLRCAIPSLSGFGRPNRPSPSDTEIPTPLRLRYPARCDRDQRAARRRHIDPVRVQGPRARDAPPAGADGFPIRLGIRSQRAGRLRAAAAGCHARRCKPLRASGRGRGIVGHLRPNPGWLEARRTPDQLLLTRHVGTERGGRSDCARRAAVEEAMTDHESSPVTTVTSAEVVTDLPNVDSALSNLYQTAAGTAEGPAPVIRALLANVVVYACTDEEADEAADAISEASGTHPCRAVILQTGDSAGASVSAVCGITERGDRRLCGEIIRLRAPAGSDATGLVLPLLAPDVPVHLWTPCRSSHLDGPERFKELTGIADQVIVDSRRFRDLRAGLGAVTGICRERGQSCVAHDLAWISLLAWRELTAQHFDPPVFRDQLDQIRQITVQFRRENVRMPSQRAASAGFLADRANRASSRNRPQPRAGRDGRWRHIRMVGGSRSSYDRRNRRGRRVRSLAHDAMWR